MTAIFIIALVSILILANFWVGFSLPLFTITMVASMLLALRFPRSGIFAIVFLTFIFERFFTLMTIFVGRDEYKLYPLDLLLVAVFFSVFFQLLGKKLIWKKQKVDYVFASFLVTATLYFMLSTFKAGNDFALAFSSFKYYAFYPLLVWATFLLFDTKDQLKRLAGFMLAGALGISGFVFYGIISGTGLWSEFTPLSTAGVRTLAFTHGFYLSMAVILAAVYLAKHSGKLNRTLWIFTLIWMVGIIGSMMRHLWIALAVAFAAIFILAAKKEKYVLMRIFFEYALTATLTFLIIMYVAFLFPRSALYDGVSGVAGVVGGRITSIANTDDESIAWRGVVWKTTMGQYLQNPFFGLGMGKKVAIEIGKYREYVEVRNIHNSFLVLLVQLGIFGTSMLFAAIYLLAGKAWHNFKKNPHLRVPLQISLGILTLHLVAFMFQPYLETNLLAIFFWINLGVLRGFTLEIKH